MFIFCLLSNFVCLLWKQTGRLLEIFKNSINGNEWMYSICIIEFNVVSGYEFYIIQNARTLSFIHCSLQANVRHSLVPCRIPKLFEIMWMHPMICKLSWTLHLHFNKLSPVNQYNFQSDFEWYTVLCDPDDSSTSQVKFSIVREICCDVDE